MNTTPHVTLDDIARRLNVSKVTVSKALRDYPDIAPATKREVQAVAKQLGYVPNFIARNLSARKSRTIGLLRLPLMLMPGADRGNWWIKLRNFLKGLQGEMIFKMTTDRLFEIFIAYNGNTVYYLLKI